MRYWRFAIAGLILATIGLPLGMPFVQLANSPEAWASFRDIGRWLELSRNSLALAFGVVLCALPPGTLLAMILYRSDLPGRVVLRRMLVVFLFVPLPLLTSAWQAALGSGSGFAVVSLDADPAAPAFSEPYWRPWLHGLGMAIWVHAAAGLPWVVWLVGQGLARVEQDAEEAGLLSAGPWHVALAITLPRAAGAILVAAIWLVVATATEITVTDMTGVRTFAEEVYSQFVSPDVGAASPQLVLARAVATGLPSVLGLMAVLAVMAYRGQRSVPLLVAGPEPRPLVCLGRLGPVVTALTTVLVLGLIAVPVTSLVLKVGSVGAAGTWTMRAAADYLRNAGVAHGQAIVSSAVCAMTTGGLTAILALLACWLARDCRWLRIGLLLTVAAAWAVPGPVAGIGLKLMIERLMNFEERWTSTTVASTLLYNGPSLLPVAWAWLIRLWPFAVAFLWPAVLLIPEELRETARLDGATPDREFQAVVWPATMRAVGAAAVAIAVLALGELSASKLVATPGAPSFAHEVFARMHYGVNNQLAAMCLLMLAMSLLPMVFLGLFARRGRHDSWPSGFSQSRDR